MTSSNQQFQFTVVIPAEAAVALENLIRAAVGNAFSKSEAADAAKRRLDVSRRAHFAGEAPPDERLLIDSQEVAKLLKLSPRTIWTMQTSGEIPKPIRIGRSIRWGYRELVAWVDAGCPAMNDWTYEPPASSS